MANDLRALMDGVASGEVALSGSAVDSCIRALDAYKQGLQDLLDGVRDSLTVTGFGSLKSGQDLADKFTSLGVADLPLVLKQHIEVAQRLQDSFEVAGRNYAEAEASAAQSITVAGGIRELWTAMDRRAEE